MKKKLLTAAILTLCAVALVATSVFATLALLTSSSGVSNVFTVGDVKISMYESKVNSKGQKVNSSGEVLKSDGSNGEPVKVDTNSYHLIPGETYTKDPTIYINSTEQDNMYLFVKSSNMIRSAEAANYSDRTSSTPLSMREQMLKNGWVEYVRSGDGVEIVWVYGTRNPDTGVITPKAVNKGTKQIRNGVEATVGGEFRLCDNFTIYEHAEVALYGAASVNFTAFAIQQTGFTGDANQGQALTKAAWEAIKGSFPYNTGIVSPINPYIKPGQSGSEDAYAAVPGVAGPWTDPLTPPTPATPPATTSAPATSSAASPTT